MEFQFQRDRISQVRVSTAAARESIWQEQEAGWETVVLVDDRKQRQAIKPQSPPPMTYFL